MAVDLSRVASKALEAAIEDAAPHRRRGSTLRAMAAGAALAVGARAAMSGKTPFLLRHMPGISELRDIPDRVRDRLADAGWLDDEADVDDAPEDEEPEAEGGEDYEDEEPQDVEDEEDEDLEDEEDEDLEDDDGPQAQADEDDEEEDYDDEEEEPEDEPAPELEVESEDDEDLHPEDRPPKPPRSKTGSRR